MATSLGKRQAAMAAMLLTIAFVSQSIGFNKFVIDIGWERCTGARHG